MWYERVKRFYDAGLWTKEMVKDAVRCNKITAAEFKNITGQDYDA